MSSLAGKVAVVTGGASGIGSATVRLFVAEGARVVVGDVQEQKGKALATELGSAVHFVPADVTRESDVRTLVESASSVFGRLDCLFNNAGVGGARGLEDVSVEEFDQTVAVLLRGVFLGMKHAVPILRQQGSGSIINTASVAGIHGGLGPHVYSACKAAVVQLSRSTAVELGPHGVRVNAICPGGILTPILTDAVGGGDQASVIVEGFLRGLQPIGRAGQPEDIARAALWLASDAASFVTGHAIVVDGGLTAGRMHPGAGS